MLIPASLDSFVKANTKKNELFPPIKRIPKNICIDCDGPFYAYCCKETLGEKRWGEIVTGGGVCSSTGYGDGCYEVYGKTDKDGKLVYVIAIFINGN